MLNTTLISYNTIAEFLNTYIINLKSNLSNVISQINAEIKTIRYTPFFIYLIILIIFYNI